MKKTKGIRKIKSFLAAVIIVLGGSMVAYTQNIISRNNSPQQSGLSKTTIGDTSTGIVKTISVGINNSERLGGEMTITQSSSLAVVAGSVHCGDAGLHADNSYWRAFNLTDFGITDPFNVTSVAIGVESAAAPNPTQPITVRLYQTSMGVFPSGARTQIGTADFALPSPQSLSLVTIPVTGSTTNNAELVVEIFTPDGGEVANSFFIGSNPAGQTGPSYLSAADCGITAPATTASIGFPNMHIVMTVTGTVGAVAPVDAPFDFDGDGKTDLSVFRPFVDPATPDFYIRNSSNGNSTGASFGIPGDLPAPADYDGDGKDDIAVWRSGAQGTFYVLRSSDSTLVVDNFGTTGDVPVSGDWDGDGSADVAVYRAAAQSTFYYRGSSNNAARNITFLPWGTTGDKVVRGDYDGDGKLDAAIFRPSTGTWYVRQSSNGNSAINIFGIMGDKLVPADYDGDNKTDLAVYRNGTWYVRRSSDSGFSYVTFGAMTDVPVPGDYDGDGKADIAVFRNGIWYIQQSSNGNTAVQVFGQAADTPLPASYNQ